MPKYYVTEFCEITHEVEAPNEEVALLTYQDNGKIVFDHWREPDVEEVTEDA